MSRNMERSKKVYGSQKNRKNEEMLKEFEKSKY